MTERRYRFRPAHRVRKQREFDRVYKAKAIKRSGPLRVHAVSNELEHPRLGLSVSRRVGNAVVRNRIKRRLREAFRLSQYDLGRYDFVVVVLRHDVATLDDYRSWLLDAAERLDRHWRRKEAAREETGNAD